MHLSPTPTFTPSREKEDWMEKKRIYPPSFCVVTETWDFSGSNAHHRMELCSCCLAVFSALFHLGRVTNVPWFPAATGGDTKQVGESAVGNYKLETNLSKSGNWYKSPSSKGLKRKHLCVCWQKASISHISEKGRNGHGKNNYNRDYYLSKMCLFFLSSHIWHGLEPWTGQGICWPGADHSSTTNPRLKRRK